MSDTSEPGLVLFGGKGGVGKTTCASATAVRLSRRGAETLVVSTDPAHSTGDAFDCEVGDRPTEVADGLYAIEVSPEEWFTRRYSGKLSTLLERANRFGLDVDGGDVAEVTEEGLVPGADELAVVDVCATFATERRWDAVVFDTAPTGHTLRLLQLPDVVATTLSKLATIQSGVDTVTAAASRLFGNDSGQPGSVTEDIEAARSRLETVSELLTNADRTQFNVVTNAERMALEETARLHDDLQEADIRVGDVIANRVRLEVNERCEHCTAQRRRQMELLSEFESDLGVDTHRIPSLPGLDTADRVDDIAERVPVPDGTVRTD